MKHSIDVLFRIAYQYYPHGVWDEDPRYEESAEFRRLDELRKQGVKDPAWLALLDRLRIRLQGEIHNRSIPLALLKSDACYRVTHALAAGPNDPQGYHEIGLAISFIAPYYVVYSSRNVDRTYDPDAPRLFQPFNLYDDELVDAQIMVEEMKALFPEHEPMPPEIGNIVVPSVMAGNQAIGKATLYHCLFTDSW
jgi:hypothetical protein